MSATRRRKPTQSELRAAEREKELQKELDQLKITATELGLRVRIEPGNFSSGSCLLEDQRMIIINRRLTLEERVRTLTRELEMLSEQEGSDRQDESD